MLCKYGEQRTGRGGGGGRTNRDDPNVRCLFLIEKICLIFPTFCLFSPTLSMLSPPSIHSDFQFATVSLSISLNVSWDYLIDWLWWNHRNNCIWYIIFQLYRVFVFYITDLDVFATIILYSTYLTTLRHWAHCCWYFQRLFQKFGAFLIVTFYSLFFSGKNWADLK